MGDALTVLRTLPSDSVHCCVTSPPYFGLRDYGVPGQMGLEATPDEYIAALVEVFAEVRRVLRPEATLWLNIGDSYAGSGKGKTGWNGIGNQQERQGFHDAYHLARDNQQRARWPNYAKPKDLLLIPFRLALALQADGWYVRSDIAWCKRSCMPESVQDRPTNAWEHVFLLSKQARYFYDAAAVREESAQDEHNQRYAKSYDFDLAKPGNGQPGNVNHVGLHSRPGPGGANQRNFWLLGPAPYSEAHFAAFVPEIPRRAILAGCPVDGTVLDPFGGAGTTALVAERLGRNAILVELNPEYAAMAQRRINGESPMFSEVSVA